MKVVPSLKFNPMVYKSLMKNKGLEVGEAMKVLASISLDTSNVVFPSLNINICIYIDRPSSFFDVII
jgi:hypothetical protein